MIERKLEVTQKLEDLSKEGLLSNILAILNLPSANYCEKRAERVLIDNKLQQPCFGCITQKIKTNNALNLDQIKHIIDFFAKGYGTRFITINGRGDPFHPKVKKLNLGKIRYAFENYGIQSYVFTSGSNLDDEVCSVLNKNDANIMISLLGNQFIDHDFFNGKKYENLERPLKQNQEEIARNIRRLIQKYDSYLSQPEQSLTRIGMNYVVSEKDLDNETKLKKLKQAANDNGLFFICNLPFNYDHLNFNLRENLKQIARFYSNFNIPHSTSVNGQCQMGAGSSITIDYDGAIYRCPYMEFGDNGKFQHLNENSLMYIVDLFMKDKQLCTMRILENE